MAELINFFFSRYRLWAPEVFAFMRRVIELSPWRVLLKLGGGFVER